MNKTERNKIIKRAKALLQQREETKWEICRLAMEVCDIHRGGHRVAKGKKKPYTLYDFADDIGMHGKTLSNWVLNYKRVVLKLEINTEAIPPAAKSTFSGAVERTRKRTKPDDSKTKVRKVFDEEYSGRTKEARNLDSYVNMTSNLIHFIETANLKKLNKAKIGELKENIATLYDIL